MANLHKGGPVRFKWRDLGPASITGESGLQAGDPVCIDDIVSRVKSVKRRYDDEGRIIGATIEHTAGTTYLPRGQTVKVITYME